MQLAELWQRIQFWRDADRIGPDMPLTHWRLHFKSTMRTLCECKFMRFGVGAEFRPGAYAISCGRISIGDRVIVRPGSMLFADPREDGAHITIENDVMMGSNVHIYVHNHRFDDPDVPIIDQGYYPSKSVILKRGCWVGASSVILPGVTIGENAVVGAGSVVVDDIPDRMLAAGNPARVVREIGRVRGSAAADG